MDESVDPEVTPPAEPGVAPRFPPAPPRSPRLGPPPSPHWRPRSEQPEVVPPGQAGPTGGMVGWQPVQPQVRVVVESTHRSVNGMSIVSMVLGIVSFFMPWLALASLAAVGFGLTARSQIRRFKRESGDGFAVAGITLGIVSFLYYLIVFRGIFLFWMPW